ncbi:helix-turn-helix domain-containing protein [Nonomuraea insulae]|uniref:Helix-turn-helix domain-containing protein n=1 Tax=Nonomuraea insulae TaxID=1616787 RepID=A0ABW1CN08_9ACTN
MTDKTPQQPATLADKLDRLFDTMHPPDRGPYSNEEVASAIRSQGGPTISGTYIWYLRKGERENPTIKHIEALARFFGVPPAYFLDEEIASEVDAQLSLLNALKDTRVKDMALRVAGLSAESLATIGEVVDRMRKLEKLPGSDSGPEPTGSR